MKWSNLLWGIVTLAIAVIAYLVFGRDVPQIIADYIDKYIVRNIDDTELSKREIDQLVVPAEYRFDSIAFGDFPEIQGEYSTDALIPPEPLTFTPSNFRVANFENSSAVFWPKECNAEGCRYDIFKGSIDARHYIGRIRALYLRASTRSRNGLPIFVDGNRRAYWWDGAVFRQSPKEPAESTFADCRVWFDAVGANEAVDGVEGRSLRGVIGLNKPGNYFIALDTPVCTRKGDDYLIQTGIWRVGLSASEDTLKQAISLVSEVEVKCKTLMTGGSIHWPFQYMCNIASVSGRDYTDEKTIHEPEN